MTNEQTERELIEQLCAPDWKERGYTSPAAEIEDMTTIGRSLMEEIERVTKYGRLKGWAPADSPVEIVCDLLNMLEESPPPIPLEDEVERLAEMLWEATGRRLISLTPSEPAEGVNDPSWQEWKQHVAKYPHSLSHTLKPFRLIAEALSLRLDRRGALEEVGRVIVKWEQGRNHDEGAFNPDCQTCLMLADFRAALSSTSDGGSD